MVRKMVINAIDPEEVRIAVLKDGKLEHFDIETRGTEKNKGNIYKAKVIDVEPSLNAAFVDYGAEKQGFLTAGDVDPRLSSKLKNDGGNRKRGNYSIEDLLKPRQDILVQVTKDEVGSKGAVLTTYLSLAGRYLVLTPDSNHQGVSRKIDDEERDALFETVSKLDVPEGMGVILRTAGKDRSIIDLRRDLKVLTRLWDNILKESESAKAPKLIYKDQDLIIRALRDYYTADIDEVILDSDDAYDRAAEYIHMVMPRQRSVLSRYVERRPIFHHYQIEEQLEDLFNPVVSLPSGGSIVIEPTEALVSIDVNSGKQKSGGHEETALQTNLEAAVEVARQLRLRDLGGIIVIDFIDMVSRKNQARVERALKSVCKNDKARIKIGRISRNGTLEITRQRLRTALAASVFRSCPVCNGTGRILNPESHATAILRRILDRAARRDLLSATVRVEPEAGNILRTTKWSTIQEIEQRNNIRVEIVSEPAYSPGQVDFTFETDPNATPVEPPAPNFGPAIIPEELRAELEAAELEEAEEYRVEEEALAVEKAKERRQRKRKRRGSEREREGGKDDGFDLPSFELVDPAKLGLKRKNGPGGQEADEGAAGDKRKRRRRRRRRKPGDGDTISATEALATEAASAQAPREDGGRERSRRNGRRGGRRLNSDGKPAAAAAAESKPSTPPARAQAAQAAPRKRGFFGWLFGGGKD